MFDQQIFAERQADELRARMATFACYAEPLPAGDAGLVEAWRRYAEIDRRFTEERLTEEIDGLDLGEVEHIVEAVISPLWAYLTNFIEATEARTIAGALAKLRLMFERHSVDEEPSALPCVALIERTAAAAGILDSPPREADRAAA